MIRKLTLIAILVVNLGFVTSTQATPFSVEAVDNEAQYHQEVVSEDEGDAEVEAEETTARVAQADAQWGDAISNFDYYGGYCYKVRRCYPNGHCTTIRRCRY